MEATSQTQIGDLEFSSFEDGYGCWFSTYTGPCSVPDNGAHTDLMAGLLAPDIPVGDLHYHPLTDVMSPGFQQLSPLSSLENSFSPATASPELLAIDNHRSRQNFYDGIPFAEASSPVEWIDPQFGYGLLGLPIQQEGYPQSLQGMPQTPELQQICPDFISAQQAAGLFWNTTSDSLSNLGLPVPNVTVASLDLDPGFFSEKASSSCQADMFAAWPSLGHENGSLNHAEPDMTAYCSSATDNASEVSPADVSSLTIAPATAKRGKTRDPKSASDPLCKIPARERRKRERPSKCPVPGCSWGFQYPRGVERHIAACHKDRAHLYGVSTAKFQCPHSGCGRAYARSDHVTRHVRKKHRCHVRGV